MIVVIMCRLSASAELPWMCSIHFVISASKEISGEVFFYMLLLHLSGSCCLRAAASQCKSCVLEEKCPLETDHWDFSVAAAHASAVHI